MIRQALILAIGMALPVASCSSTEVEPVAVTGTEVCTQTADEGDVLWYECHDSTSDERVSGTLVVSVRQEQEPPTPMDGTVALTNDGGSWQGDWAGEITSGSNHIMEGVLIGSGDYEGLQYRVRWEGVTEPLAITGTIEPMR